MKHIYNFYSENSANIWNSTSKITYTYKGNTCTNYLGNYWGEYKGKDANGDGILGKLLLASWGKVTQTSS